MITLSGSRLKRLTAPISLAVIVCLAFIFWSGAGNAAQKSPLDEPSSYKVKFKTQADGSKSAYLAGTATPAGVTLKLPGLWSTQPVALVVMPDDKARRITVELRKYHWTPPLRTCSSAKTGDCAFSFTNQGEVFVKVISPSGPAKVYVGVRVAKEQTPKMKSILKSRGAKP